MSQQEIFTIELNSKSNVDDPEARLPSLRERRELAESLGLKTQVLILDKEINTIEKGSLIKSPPLSADQITIWKTWLPTTYSNKVENSRLLNAYQFDRIPSPVLKAWKSHKDSGLFESFEIWTPEKIQNDPVLVGIVGKNTYLLARWGESDNNLLSWEEIKKAALSKLRWRADVAGFSLLAGTSCGTLICVLICAVFSLFSIKILSLAGFLMVWPLVCVAVATLFSLSFTNSLSKAIARDNKINR